MDSLADMDVAPNPHMSSSKQTRILIWRSEVVSHLPPLLNTTSPSSNSSITSGASSNNSSPTTTSDPFSPHNKPPKLWARLRSRFSFSTSKDPSRIAAMGGVTSGSADSADGIRTEMYKNLAADYTGKDEEEEEPDSKRNQLKEKQERLIRAAKLLEQTMA